MTIEFHCTTCDSKLQVADENAGKAARCPGCQTILQVPTLGDADSTVPGSDAPFGSPFAPPSGSPAWLPGSGAFAPLPSEKDSSPGNFGSASPGQNPFADPSLAPPKPAPTSPFGEAGGTVNPYGSPLGGFHSHQIPSSVAGGYGLPWELAPGPSSWFETLKLIVFEMNPAFRQMRTTGGYMNPLGFYLICSLIGVLWNLGLNLGIEMLQVDRAGRRGPNIEFVLIGYAAIMVTLVFLMPVLCFLVAGLLHLSLKLVGGANLGYETTFRVTAFTWGAINIVSIVPCFGGCIAFIWGAVCLVAALTEAHRCSTGQAIGALILSFLAYVALVVGIIFSIAGVAALVA
jgi:hypothetical protein